MQSCFPVDKRGKCVGGSTSGSSRNLWVSGLSSSTRATDLKQVFSKYGKVRPEIVFLLTNIEGVWVFHVMRVTFICILISRQLCV